MKLGVKDILGRNIQCLVSSCKVIISGYSINFMQLEDSGIILDLKKFGESGLIVSCLTKDHGIIKGIYKQRKTKYGTQVIPGNIMQTIWKARLEEHLGTFTLENETNITAALTFERNKLAILNSAIAMCNLLLHEKDPQPEIYDQLKELLVALTDSNEMLELLEKYVWLEIELLNKSGFGMDLSQCAATGANDNLIYVSPKSGCAVSEVAGEPYKDRMLKLPEFLLSRGTASKNDITEALKLTHYFMNKHIFSPFNKKLPTARNRLIESI